jgi:hypothetical protein
MASHSSATFGFQGNGNESAYFSMRDKCIEGHIGTIDGEKLNVRYVLALWTVCIGLDSNSLTDSLFRLQQNAFQDD